MIQQKPNIPKGWLIYMNKLTSKILSVGLAIAMMSGMCTYNVSAATKDEMPGYYVGKKAWDGLGSQTIISKRLAITSDAGLAIYFYDLKKNKDSILELLYNGRYVGQATFSTNRKKDNPCYISSGSSATRNYILDVTGKNRASNSAYFSYDYA